MDLAELLGKLFESSTVTIQSSVYLADKVRSSAAKLDADRRKKKQLSHVRKPKLVPVPKECHNNALSVTPWELLHTLGRATILSGQGSSRALAS